MSGGPAQGSDRPLAALARRQERARRRIPVVFADDVLDAMPEGCVAVAVERVARATPLARASAPRARDVRVRTGERLPRRDDARALHTRGVHPRPRVLEAGRRGRRGALRPHCEAVGASVPQDLGTIRCVGT